MSFIQEVSYLVAAVFFILGIKKLGSPKTARFGNTLAMTGMLVAVVVTLLDRQILNFDFIIIGLVAGSAIGIVAAKKVEMTAMPQMVALSNSHGGGASALVAFAQQQRFPENTDVFFLITVILSLFIGTSTFTGSFIAFAKLQGIMKGSPIVFKGQMWLNATIFIAVIVLFIRILSVSPSLLMMVAMLLLSGILGVMAVIPIGGADMPVVISLLNSLSGLAAAATGFALASNILVISGSLVGASGIILTNIMCRAMNRSLFSVLFGAVGVSGEGSGRQGEKREVAGYSVEEAGMMFETAREVIIVPGYGLAVAQAQHVLRELAVLLEDRGVNVRYAIHPVAGRMPGHMNVLLAEASVPYEQLVELEAINNDFRHTDIALVIGANDVINPAARTKKESVLYGMPILNVDQAKSVMIIKRSLSPGFSGEDNDLFYQPKTMMIFGDARKVLTELVQYLKG
jgi:NAD(P) transhydrogenase subunit beta